jgi:protein-export membrane protein SecD
MQRKNWFTILFILLLAFFAGNLLFPQVLNLKIIPEKPFKLGLDLQGGTHLVYEADLSKIEVKNQSSSMQGLRDVIERRINLFGVQEPIVQVQENEDHYRLVVELAGIEDPAQAIEMIGETPYLEFKEQRPEEETELILAKQKELEGKTAEEAMQVADWQLALEDPYFQATALNGQYLAKAEVGFDQTTYTTPLVLLEFNEEGAKIFEELTEKNLGKRLAIYIDNLPLSAPVVQNKITGGQAQIIGNFTIEEARSLARNLSAGALPVPINLISQQTVGPTLGAVSLQESLRAGLIGFLAVAIFMILFYRLPGLLASLALCIYAALVLSLFKLVPITLTLAGIGGFILSIGMAVDANVLIFSRLKEELNQGKSLNQAIEDGFDRAWSSIRDGNLTTLIVAAILFAFGTSFIKGFALTLSLGILISMFSAIIITKSFLRLMASTKLRNVKILWR